MKHPVFLLIQYKNAKELASVQVSKISPDNIKFMTTIYLYIKNRKNTINNMKLSKPMGNGNDYKIM